MKHDKNIIVLNKMVKYCGDSRKYAVEKTYDEFINDERSLVFSIFSLSQLGELVASLDASVLKNNDNIPWNALKSIRNRIVHDYDGVQYKIIWNVIQNEIPKLVDNLRKIIDKLVNDISEK